MFDSIKSIIGDIASGAIKDQRIALSQEQLAALESKLVSLAGELTASKSRESKLAVDNEQLRGQLGNLHPIAKPADVCPYCRRETGELVDMKPHRYLGPAGAKVGYYKCSSCDKTYDKLIDH